MFLALLAHGLVFLAPLQFDDEHQIVLNPAMHDLGSIPRFFVDPWLGSALGYLRFFRPLLFTTFVLDSTLGGGRPLPYRVTSLLLLLVYATLTAIFVRVLVPRLVSGVEPLRAQRIALLSAALVLVHPLLNESILLVSGRSSLLMAVWGIAALTLISKPSRSRSDAAWILVLTCLALLTKESAVVLGLLGPVVALLVRPESRPLSRLKAAWPVVVPVALYVVVLVMLPRISSFQPFSAAPATAPESISHRLPVGDRAAQAAVALTGLARLFVLPIDLSLVHEVGVPAGWQRFGTYLLWPALLGVIIALWRAGGGRRLAGFALLWFSVALLPIVAAGLNTPMAEHRTVLAVAAPIGLAAYGLTGVNPRWLGRALTIGLTLGLATLAALQTWPWRSAVELWKHEVERDSDNARAWSWLGKAYEAQGDLARATDAIGRAVELAPEVPQLLGQAAMLEHKKGDLESASRLAGKALAGDPSFAELHLIVAEQLATAGRYRAALEHTLAASRLKPGSSAVWNAVGNVRLLLGDPGAVEAYERALSLDADNREARSNLERAREGFGSASPR